MRKNKLFLFLILLIFLGSCSKKEEESYVVKVGDFYLTEAMIEKSLNSNMDTNKFREEFIREWIETKLIYLDALKTDIVDSKEYEKIITSAKIEIANALVIKKIIADNSITSSEKELKEFYNNNRTEFKVVSPRLIFNQVTFGNRSAAIKFRKMVVRKGWKNSIKYFSANNIQISVRENKFEYSYNILQENLKKQLLQIDENKYSSVIEISKNTFAVIQLVERYKKNDVPEFEKIKDEVEQKYFSFKRKKLYDNYLKELYVEYSSEITR